MGKHIWSVLTAFGLLVSVATVLGTERPGLTQPPQQSPRDPITVPDSGSAALLLGSTFMTVAGLRLMLRRSK
jgi:hypothetical protein